MLERVSTNIFGFGAIACISYGIWYAGADSLSKRDREDNNGS